jgi:hypothetical protein
MSHWPLVQAILNMDGFELTVFVLCSIVLFLGIGFATDYVMTSSGMGPYWNAAYALLGGYAGLCVARLVVWSLSGYEPELTIYLVLTGLATTLLSATVIATWR